jgi:bifunctional enzyme CysN/CysC
MDVKELLRINQESDLLRFTTAGSVDDGKSTLIGRLLYDSKGIYEDQLASVIKSSKTLNREFDLALLLDGLKAEQEQGITIDVAYRYFSTPSRRFIIADTPGHEQYTRNMVTGASTANLAVILIDAYNGITTQSKRHAFIASLLGIPHVVVCVNKMDLVDYDRDTFEYICHVFSEFISRLKIPDLTFIPISALKGDNVVNPGENMPWYRGRPLLSHLEDVYIGSDRNLIDFRFPVQYVNRPDSNFRGYCGQVASGVARVGYEITVLPGGKRSRISKIVTHDGEFEFAFPPQSVTLCLEDDLDISRGNMIVYPRNLPKMDNEIEAMIVWMSNDPLDINKLYLFKHTTQTIRCRISELFYKVSPDDLRREHKDNLELNEIGRVVINLFHPVFYDEYARNRSTGNFIIIDSMTNSTVGAGMIIERGKHKTAFDRKKSEAPVSTNISEHRGLVSPPDRHRIMGHKPVTIWLTGLSGSGKSTIAFGVEKKLTDLGHACYVLDGDNVRHGLNRDLGFKPEDRTENIRRIAEVARLLNDAGLIAITAFISPYREDREKAREIIGTDNFLEIFIDTPIEICENRDSKGLYRKAKEGIITEFTGISAPYEKPLDPTLQIPAGDLEPEECINLVISLLRGRNIFNG